MGCLEWWIWEVVFFGVFLCDEWGIEFDCVLYWCLVDEVGYCYVDGGFDYGWWVWCFYGCDGIVIDDFFDDFFYVVVV